MATAAAGCDRAQPALPALSRLWLGEAGDIGLVGVEVGGQVGEQVRVLEPEADLVVTSLLVRGELVNLPAQLLADGGALRAAPVTETISKITRALLSCARKSKFLSIIQDTCACLGVPYHLLVG